MPVRCFIVMGVSGCGKSSVAKAFAEQSGGVFLDADDFHPQANVEKMSKGIPLEDADRWGWLDVLNDQLRRHEKSGEGPLFMACSALKKAYRDRLRDKVDVLEFLFLNGSFELINERMQAREDHFMPPGLLESQFEALEKPEHAIWFDIVDPIDVICEKFFRQYPKLKR
ncbi:MAG: gluconokinase [Verrucomicrobiota bacterium]